MSFSMMYYYVNIASTSDPNVSMSNMIFLFFVNQWVFFFSVGVYLLKNDIQ